ncbi:MAG: hypothetical protein KBF73_06470 [Flavobacteriales bacterium]|nr:hypothetical protein [Flavobacteriales bacterium]
MIKSKYLNKWMGYSGALAFAAIFMVGCVSDVKKDDGEGVAVVDSSANKLMTIGGNMFSIPSPIQTAMLIEKSGADYNKSFLNDAKKVTTYATNYQKALNLGVYGADVGYVTIYDQSQDAIKYLSVINKLSDELGITGAFDENTIKRFENNFGKRDSMLNLVAVAYRNSDAFLKDNDRMNVGALILAGGWIETLYFSTQIAVKDKNQDVINRIGEQKYTLNNIVKMLTQYYNQPEYDVLVDDLIELAYDFDAIDIQYTYEKSTVDVAKKTTKINSKTVVVITPEHLKAIADKVAKIRNKIVGQQ